MSPRIPVWGESVQPRPMPSARISADVQPEAFGAGTGRAVERVGGALMQVGETTGRIADRQMEIEDRRVVREAYRNAAAEMRNVRNDIYSRRGRNAEGALEEARQRIDDIGMRYSDTFSRPSQQDLFRTRWDSLVESSLDNFSRHEEAQRFLADEENSDAIITGAIDDAIGNYTSPQAIRKAWSDVTIEIREKADRNGWDETKVAGETERLLSEMHTKIIDRIMLDDPQMAENYYIRFKDQISGQIQGDIEAKLQAKSLDRFAQDTADALVAKHGRNGERAALAEIREQYSGDREAKLISETKIRYTDLRRLEDEDKERRLDDATKRIMKAGSLSDAIRIANSEPDGSSSMALYKLAESIYADKQIKTSLMNIAEAESMRAEIDEARRKDKPLTTSQVMLMAAEKKLTIEQTQDVLKYSNQAGLYGELTQSRVDTIVKALKNDPKAKLSSIGMTLRDIADALPAGKAVTDTAISEIIARNIASGEHITEGWVDPDMTFKQAQDRGVGHLWLPDITKDEEKSIAAILKKAGKRVDQQTMRLYKKHIILGIPKPEPVKR